MRVFIPSARKAALNVFRRGTERDYAVLDEIERRQENAAAVIFNHVLSGGAVEMVSGDCMKIITKSIRGENSVTISHFCMIRGEWEPTSHHDSFNAHDLLNNVYHGVSVFLQ